MSDTDTDTDTDTARGIVEAWEREDNTSSPLTCDTGLALEARIAAALSAERERCAKILDKEAKEYPHDGLGVPQLLGRLATTIRQGGPDA